MSNRFLLAIVAILVIFGGVFWYMRDGSSSNTNSTSSEPTNHVSGEGKKNVTLIEYGDFQCPACGSYYPIVKQLKEQYKEDIIFQFRNFPLTQIHPNAMASHRAAEAADKQGKFWEMHDTLYENQDAWESASNPSSIFESYAGSLGLNIDQYRQDVASSETNDRINADIKAGQALGATSTPTFVLDGKKIEENPRDIESFTKLIDEAIAAKNPSS